MVRNSSLFVLQVCKTQMLASEGDRRTDRVQSLNRGYGIQCISGEKERRRAGEQDLGAWIEQVCQCEERQTDPRGCFTACRSIPRLAFKVNNLKI